jgi:hypothetical protein
MSTSITLTAVVALAFAAGGAIVPRGPDIGAAPAPSASPPAEATPLHDGLLTPGDYTVAPFGGAEWAPCGPAEDRCPEASVDDDLRFTFTVPDGWAGAPLGSDIWLASFANSGPAGAGFLIGRGGWLSSDPCADEDPDVPVGPTVEDFVEALVSHPALEVGEPIDVSVGGYAGKYLDLQAPADLSDCPYFRAWDPTFYAQGPSNQWHIWVLDVDGVRVVIHGSDYPGTAPERSEELRDIVESIRIEHDPSLAPRPSPSTAGSASTFSGWPAARPENNPAGQYSWLPGRVSWMHRGELEMTFFRVDEAAFGLPASVLPDDVRRTASDFAGPTSSVPALVADLQDADAHKQLWYVDRGDTRMFLLVQAPSETSPAALAESEAIIRSIRPEPMEHTGLGFRLVFSLPAGWDSG